MMENALGLTTALNTLASAIACHLEDEELELLAAALVQLGDTLETIAAHRALEKRCCERGCCEDKKDRRSAALHETA